MLINNLKSYGKLSRLLLLLIEGLETDNRKR